MNEKTGERKYGAMAFLPLLVFLALYIGSENADAEEKKSGVSGGDAGYVGTRKKMSGSQGV